MMIHKVLFCEGSYYDIGKKRGEWFRSEINQNLAGFWDVLRVQGRDKREVMENALKYERLWAPERLEEIEGIGEGAAIEYPELLAYNLYHDLAFPEECTVLMAIGKASATGSTIFLKNSDKVGSESYAGSHYYKNKEINVILALNPHGGNKIIGIAAAGETGIKMGLNDKGVAAGSNLSRIQRLAKKATKGEAIRVKALDRRVLMREGLEGGNNALEAAQAILPNLLENPMSTPGNVEFADAHEAVIIERSYRELAAEIVRDEVAARSNRFVLLKALNREDDLSSMCRYIRSCQLLAENKGNVTMEKMMEFSMDHANGPGPNSICRHGTHFSEETSLSAAVMEIDGEKPERSKIAVALGKPCHAWRVQEAHITLDMTMGPGDIPEGLRDGETWKQFYTEEPNDGGVRS
jgi:hypothetical protein